MKTMTAIALCSFLVMGCVGTSETYTLSCNSDIDCPVGTSCDPWEGICLATGAVPVADAVVVTPPDGECPEAGAACDDGDPCTTGDACDADLECTGTAYSCDDGFACTTDTCDGAGGCSYSMRAGQCLIDGNCYDSGAENPNNSCQECQPSVTVHAWGNDDNNACDAALPCAEKAACQAGVCVSTAGPKSCDDGLACTTDSCDPKTGCVHAADDAACDDGSSCTVDTCTAKEGCVATPKEEGAECSDDDDTTGGDKCNAEGLCVGAAITCAATQCEESSTPNGTDCTVVFKASGETCDDGDMATSDDTCDGSGQCAGAAISCAPTQCESSAKPNGSDCTVEYKAAGETCDDGDTATGADVCDGKGACAGTAIVCDPSQCEVSSIPNGTDCTVELKDVGTDCDDGDPKTTEDKCDKDGVCAGI